MQASTDHNPSSGQPTIAVVMKGYPRLSETFIAQELHGLEQRGYRLLLVSTHLVIEFLLTVRTLGIAPVRLL